MPDSRLPWREPTTVLPLRWGGYRARLVAGICLVFAGGLLVQLTSTYTLLALPFGLISHIAGWWILPAIGWRRVLSAAVSAVTMMMLLNGAAGTVFLVFPLAAWLLVRQRPPLSYATLIIPPIVGWFLAQFFPDYGWGVVVLLIAGTALAGAAWLGRSLSPISTSRGDAEK